MSAAEETGAVDVTVLRGTPTDEELAALIAALSEAYTAEEAHAVVAPQPTSVWNRSGRGLRTPLRRDIPWGRFSG